MEHVHNLALAGTALLVGSHEGLYRQEPGETPVRVGEPFDVMGFTKMSDRWLASGHPGPGMQAPPDLGLLESTDEGRNWSAVSLSGEADFHRLTGSGKTVLGVNSGDGLLWRSTDAGKNWNTVEASLYDVALDPQDPDSAVATTPEGPQRSRDGGQTWSPIADAPLLSLLAWHDDGLTCVTPEGRVQTSSNGGRTWKERGTVKGTPVALAAAGDQVALLAGDTVWFSSDSGASFKPRITAVAGH